MRIISLFFLLISINVFSQENQIFYYNATNTKVDSIDAVRFEKISYKDKKKTYQLVENYSIDGKLLGFKNYINWIIEQFDIQIYLKNGASKIFHNNGVLKSYTNFKLDKFHGKIITYYDNGQLKRDDNFLNDKFVSGRCFDKKGNEIKHFNYIIAPIYKGGEKEIHKFLYQNVKIPPRYKRLGISGNVLLKFTVLKNGKLSNLEVLSSSNKVYAKESIRLIKLLEDWIPSKIDGEFIDHSFRLPLSFNIE